MSRITNLGIFDQCRTLMLRLWVAEHVKKRGFDKLAGSLSFRLHEFMIVCRL